MIIGPLAGLAYLLFKAYNKGKEAKELEQHRIQEMLEMKIKGAEAKNATEDWKRDQRINDIGNVKSMLDLIQLWNKRFDQKSSDKPPSEKP